MIGLFQLQKLNTWLAPGGAWLKIWLLREALLSKSKLSFLLFSTSISITFKNHQDQGGWALILEETLNLRWFSLDLSSSFIILVTYQIKMQKCSSCANSMLFLKAKNNWARQNLFISLCAISVRALSKQTEIFLYNSV